MGSTPIAASEAGNLDPVIMANAIRALSMDAVEAAKSGHPGMPMGAAEVATVLFTQFLKFDPVDPRWPDRDRFILSAGHGSMLLYALSHLLGYKDVSIEEIKNFRQLGSKTAGHPEYGVLAAAETTTGPLGQGLANAVGMAIAEAHLNARFGSDLVDHKTYALVGDGCLMEGISHEAIGLAGHLKLRNLIVLWDDNEITIDGAVSLSDSTNQLQRFEAAGWATKRIDGHDPSAIEGALRDAQTASRPTLISCKTVIGRGAPSKQGTSGSHGAPLGSEEIAAAREAINWPHAPFEVPSDVLSAWRAAGSRGAATRRDWQACLEASPKKTAFNEALIADVTPAVEALAAFKRDLVEEKPSVASRKASQMALDVINQAVEFTIGGSADLTGSNNTKTKTINPLTSENYGGRYVYYGIREHGMAAAMNGLALHRGVVPYGGTFLVFTDYCRPSIRLSALMEQRVIYVMTHDSIGLGEDGPTHQPVEHLASLRAMPNLTVFRPCDAVETAECWAAALANTKGPSIIALSRQSLAPARLSHEQENLSAKGAYIVADAPDPHVTLIATGSEVGVAIAAQQSLACDAVRARVVSAPCFELFAAQSVAYKSEVLGAGPRICVEAGVQQGWDQFLRSGDAFGDQFIGMSSFGESGPIKALYEHFGITAEAVDAAARKAAQV
ncbi:MAG: transketolase [Pseudomonadota bacterium]